MEPTTLLTETIAGLKVCFHWKKHHTSTIADRKFLSVFIDFVKSQIIGNSEKAKTAFQEFENDYTNLRLEGRLEGWIETGIENNINSKNQLELLIEEVKQYKEEKETTVKLFGSSINTEPVKEEPKKEEHKPIVIEKQVVVEKIVTESKEIVEEKPIIQEQTIEEPVTPIEQKTSITKPEEELKIPVHEQVHSEKDEKSADIIYYEEESDDLEGVMDFKQGPILVPWDFSDIAEYALQHSMMYAKHLGGDVTLVHIVKKDKDIPAATQRFITLTDDIKKKYGLKPNYIIREGNIFDTITEVADSSNAKLVIMGTHGIKGMQKLTGSWALKVITGTNSPFIVVQTSPTNDNLKTVVFPVDHTRESKQKLKQAKLLADHYKNVRFKVCKQALISNNLFLRNTTTNISYIKSYFRQYNIEHDIVNLDCTNLVDGILKYSALTNPDLIMILTTKNISISDYMLGADEQKVIANEARIPVMCINPMKVKFKSYGSLGL